MNIDKENQFGSINITIDAIASIAANACIQCYGVIGMASKKNVEGHDILLSKENITKGVSVKKDKQNIYEIDLFIVVAYGVRITEVCAEVQKKVKYDLEQKLKTKFKAINVYVQGIKNI